MSENEEVKPEAKQSGELAMELNFAPSWARTDPDANMKRYRETDYEQDADDARRPGGGRDGFRDRRPRRDSDRDHRRFDRDRPPRPRRDADRDRPEMPRPESRGAVANLASSDGAPREHRPQTGDRRPPRRPNVDRRPPRPETPPLPVTVRVLPEQKALGAVIRRIQTSHRAYPLRDIASLFLDNPASCLLRIEPNKDQQVPLFQCKVCGMPALSEEEIRAHLMNRHFEDFFEVEEIACDPPNGTFVCVARCGLSGELLGPPNHHSYNAKIHEMLRTRYPNMSEEAYRSRIETVRDPEVIEQWRQQCVKKKVYRQKNLQPAAAEPQQPTAENAGSEETPPAPKAPALERDVAEMIFAREILPAQIQSAKHLVCTAAVAMQTPSRPLYYAMKDVLVRERRFPVSLFYALRGAFHHRKLNLFRVNDAKGLDFVMLRQPVKLESEHTVQTLKDVLEFVTANPGCTKAEMLEKLAGTDEAKSREALVQLAWLVEKGHVIHYYNDVLCAPMDHPVFKFLPSERRQCGGPKPNAMNTPVTPDPVPESAPAPEAAAPAAEAAPAPEASASVPEAETPAVEAAASASEVTSVPESAPAPEAVPEQVPASEELPATPAE